MAFSIGHIPALPREISWSLPFSRLHSGESGVGYTGKSCKFHVMVDIQAWNVRSRIDPFMYRFIYAHSAYGSRPGCVMGVDQTRRSCAHRTEQPRERETAPNPNFFF